MVFASVSFVPCFAKNIINIVQLVNAANALVELDKEERRELHKKQFL